MKAFYKAGAIATLVLAVPFMVGGAVFGDSWWFVAIVVAAALFHYLAFACLPLYIWYKVFDRLSNPSEAYYPVFLSGFYVFVISAITIVILGNLYGYVSGAKYLFSEIASIVFFIFPGYVISALILRFKCKNITRL